MEDIIEKDDYVIEYVGKIKYKRRENNYIMKINGMNLWINRDKSGGPAQYKNYSCNPNCELVQEEVKRAAVNKEAWPLRKAFFVGLHRTVLLM